MADLLATEELDYREVGHYLAGISGVDLTRARPKTVRLWEARGLGLLAMARGDMAEALRIMANIKTGRERGKKTGASRAPKETGNGSG